MNKKSVEEAILKGSVKQKAIILGNDLAEKTLGGSGFLTEDEIKAIVGSFKTDREVMAYRKYRVMFDKLNLYCSNLAQLQFQYIGALREFEKYLLIQESHRDTEDLLTRILDLIPEGDLRSKAIDAVLDHDNRLLWRFSFQEKGGFLSVVDGDDALLEITKFARENAENLQRELITWVEVYKEYVKDTGYRIQAFAAFIKSVENYLKSVKNVALESKRIRFPQYPDRYQLERKLSDVKIDRERLTEIRTRYLDV